MLPILLAADADATHYIFDAMASGFGALALFIAGLAEPR